jgi:hypothetical protein
MAKAKYDKSKDKTIAIMGLQANATTQFEVRVMQYDGGEVKLQLRRMYKDTNGDFQYSFKLGRFKKDELMAVIRLMTSIAPHFDIQQGDYGDEFELIGVKKEKK